MLIRKLLACAVLCGASLIAAPQSDLLSLLKSGAAYEERENWRKAAEVYTQVTELYPSQAVGFERLGDVNQKNGAWAQAAENYRKALALSPGDTGLQGLIRACELAAEQEKTGVVQQTTYRDLSVAVKTRGVSLVMSRIPVKITFPRNKYSIQDLDETARKQLDEVAGYLLSPEWISRRPVIVEGNTCSCGSDAANLTLGKKRGEAVLAYLISKNALKPGEATVVSMGKSNPIVVPAQENLSAEVCQRDDAHNQNRRVIIKEAKTTTNSPLVTFWYRPVGSSILRPLTEGSVLGKGSEMSVKIQVPSPMYAYVVHRGPGEGWEVLYRTGKQVSNAQMEGGGAGYWVPGEDGGFTVRGSAGVEEAMVYLSPTKIPEFEVSVPTKGGGTNGDQKNGGNNGVTPPPPPPPQQTAPQPGKPMVFELSTARGLTSSAKLKVAALPKSTRAAARVTFKTQD